MKQLTFLTLSALFILCIANCKHLSPKAEISELSSNDFDDINDLLVFSNQETGFFRHADTSGIPKHVHLMHLDGFRPDAFKTLLRKGQLPHFSFLLSRGKISFKASTVDKSETMKVILSYLSSRIDTYVTGWWQFNRDMTEFENVWLDPIGVINYAVGTRYPRYPTIFDFLAANGREVIGGFSLHRRSVPFNQYSRNYIEGIKGAFQHLYFHQADATMNSLTKIYDTMSHKDDKQTPAFAASVLAPADEFGHFLGITRDHHKTSTSKNFCVERPNGDNADQQFAPFFSLLDSEVDGGYLEGLVNNHQQPNGKYIGYFNEVTIRRDKVNGNDIITRFCIDVPKEKILIPAHKNLPAQQWRYEDKYLNPRYILGMMMVDIQLGKLIRQLRLTRYSNQKARTTLTPGQLKAQGIVAYVKQAQPESSLLENTMFLFAGDHGMVDTNRQMSIPNLNARDQERSEKSLNQPFVKLLNDQLGLGSVLSNSTNQPSGEKLTKKIGIDDSNLPDRLKNPQLHPAWQVENTILQRVADSRRFADSLFEKLEKMTEKAWYDQHDPFKKGFVPQWYYFFVPSFIVRKKIREGVKPHKEMVVRHISRMYLSSDPAYKTAETRANQAYYNNNVGLIYGGAARNNAEIFIPHIESGIANWQKRPQYESIIDYRPMKSSGVSILEALKENPGVGLIFIRKSNGSISSKTPLSGSMEIVVMDRVGGEGVISVKRDSATKKLVFAYHSEMERDPLDYGEYAKGRGTYLSYDSWNDLSIKNGFNYHNVVAGMGAYLYSNNPTIGDITVMHATGWNFGDNNGGHGGVHRNEKLSVMMASAPKLDPSELFSIVKTRVQFTQSQGRQVMSNKSSYPTVLDVAPTAIRWLGYPERSLTEFSQSGFTEYYSRWNARQRGELLEGGLRLIQTLAKKEQELPIDTGMIREDVERLLQFVPDKIPPLPNFNDLVEDGNLLDLGSVKRQ